MEENRKREKEELKRKSQRALMAVMFKMTQYVWDNQEGRIGGYYNYILALVE